MQRRSDPPSIPDAVADALDNYPKPVRIRLLQVRRLIVEVAAETEGVGPLTETLKWGEPAYLTGATGSGSTIRLGWKKSADTSCAVLFNCQTSLVETFRAQFGDTFAYEKNRAILLKPTGDLPKAPLATCLSMALTYHRRQRRPRT